MSSNFSEINLKLIKIWSKYTINIHEMVDIYNQINKYLTSIGEEKIGISIFGQVCRYHQSDVTYLSDWMKPMDYIVKIAREKNKKKF